MKKIIKRMLALCICFGLGMTVLGGCAAQPLGSDGEQQPMEIMSFPMPEGPEEYEINIPPVENISDDFIRGMDASSVLVEENSGVVYYNYEGEEQDVFMTLAQSGVNYIRLRVWNDPYDEYGNGYGGGNNDVATAIELGKRATMYGMKVCIDFHYSDFWADPKRQHAPKAWEGMTVDEKCPALYDFTKESLSAMLDAGVNVGMVQIGNEINYGMSGETATFRVMDLLKAGSSAVRETSETYGRDIQVAVHYTRITDPLRIRKIAANLEEYGVDYDVFGLSFYPFWDGTMGNMQSVVEYIIENYGKQVMIAETSYCYTSEDGDGCTNSFIGKDDLVDGYSATVQGQASMVRDVIAAANEAGAMGVFYWEGVWIPVGDADEDNSPIWEEFGSGWASSYAADYDPEDAGLYYGGCSWDNQAMFDFDGYPLASLNVFKYLKHGASANTAIDHVEEVSVAVNAGDELVLPDTVEVVFNDNTSVQTDVTWNEEQIAAVDTSVGGSYDIEGSLDDGIIAYCHIEIIAENFILNPDFEDSDRAMWKVTYSGSRNPTDFQRKAEDAHSGSTAFHFYSTSDMDFCIEQTLTDLEPGMYMLSVFAQGGDVTEDAVMELYAVTNGEEQVEPFMVTSWLAWKNPTIPEIEVTDGTLTVGVRIRCSGNGWGTIDDFTLNRIPE